MSVAAAFPDARAYTEGFVHPWGLTLLVNVASSRSWEDLTALAGHVVDWRSEMFFVLEDRPASLDEVAKRGLENLRETTFAASEAPTALQEPFSVFTPVRGSGSKNELDPARPDIHRLLHAGATFSPTWAWDTPDPVRKARAAARKHQPPQHVVFGTTRGRSVWGPAYLAQATSKHTLSCQHRNLVFASAMTQSFVEFAAATVDLGAGSMKGDHDALARRAMAALGAMYLGSRYRTGSVKTQVDASGCLGHVNALRAQLGLRAL